MSNQASTVFIQGLHHSAYRCRNTEETRAFYEDFLGLPLAGALRIEQTKTGRGTDVLHSFFQMADGSFLAFFEAPDRPFDFKKQHDFDLHIALRVDRGTLMRYYALGKAHPEWRMRGVSDHGFIESIYFRDPNGYVVELAAPTPEHDTHMGVERNEARAILDQWQSERSGEASRE